MSELLPETNPPQLADILRHNEAFVESRAYEKYLTTRFPDKKIVIVTCMDTRLVELLPRAMNLRQGDVKIIKVAGAVVSHPFGSVMRSVLVAVYELGAMEVLVVGHHGCGMIGFSGDKLLEKARQRGVTQDDFEQLQLAKVDLKKWLVGFAAVEAAVADSVAVITRHPLLPKDITVHGLVMDPETGKLDVVVDGRPPQG